MFDLGSIDIAIGHVASVNIDVLIGISVYIVAGALGYGIVLIHIRVRRCGCRSIHVVIVIIVRSVACTHVVIIERLCTGVDVYVSIVIGICIVAGRCRDIIVIVCHRPRIDVVVGVGVV